MKLLDIVKIKITSGRGGNGAATFRKEKFVPFGGPSGGNGGNGGNIYFVGTEGKNTLLDFSYRREYSAKPGTNGARKNLFGKSGEDLILKVPIGTLIKNLDNDEIILDITEPDRQYLILRGGRGGRGNSAFATPANRAPREFEYGQPGRNLNLELELKLIADVGIIGLPNAGKSTFISKVSASKAKVADYPFTTLTPNLGVVKSIYGKPYVIADMPGLIEGASEGAGLGLQFLRHIERTKLLVHFIDASDLESSMIQRYNTIRLELEKYKKSILNDKLELVVATKVESASQENLLEFENSLNNKKVYKISSFSGEGLQELLNDIQDYVDKLDSVNEES